MSDKTGKAAPIATPMPESLSDEAIRRGIWGPWRGEYCARGDTS
jgi:hypothetical protein